MSICPHTGKACTCQPQEGQLCTHGEQPSYRNGPAKLPKPRISLQLGSATMVPLYDESQMHAFYAEGFERGQGSIPE